MACSPISGVAGVLDLDRLGLTHTFHSALLCPDGLKLSQPIGTRSTPSISRVPGREGPTTDVPVKGASVMGK